MIVERLVAEFTAGAGARGTLKRSIFAVGDDKQSIFSFQGATPEAFADNATAVQACLRCGASLALPVARVQIFVPLAAGGARRGRHGVSGSRGVPRAHAPIRFRPRTPRCARRRPAWSNSGRLVEPDEKREVEAWDAPFDTTSETSPRVKLARRIAGCVRTWIARGDRVGDGDKRHPVRPGDILVLVRQRGPLFEAIIRALKDADMPVAGADRLVLTEHIAVMDLLALADALLLPDDDLALATRAQEPAVRSRRGRSCSLSRGSARDRCAPPCARSEPAMSRARLDALERLSARAVRERRLRFYADLLGAERRTPADCWRGSATRRTTRSTNSSISRSTTKAARRRRCRASSPGCARPLPRSSATWRSPATRCG